MNTPTMPATLESLREVQEITTNAWIAVATGEITEQTAVEILDAMLGCEETK